MSELGEIEAEMGPRPFSLWEQVALLNRTMGKERTLKVGDKVKAIDGQEGTITDVTREDWADIYGTDIKAEDGGLCAYLGWQLECIPVEPERVGLGCPDWEKCKRPTRCECRSYDPAFEWECPRVPATWAQRAGMAWWEPKGWFVVKFGPKGGAVIALASATEMEAQEWLKRDPTYRAFQVSQGVRG